MDQTTYKKWSLDEIINEHVIGRQWDANDIEGI